MGGTLLRYHRGQGRDYLMEVCPMPFFNTHMEKKGVKGFDVPLNQSVQEISHLLSSVSKKNIETLKVKVSKTEWRACTFNDMLWNMYESTSMSQRDIKGTSTAPLQKPWKGLQRFFPFRLPTSSYVEIKIFTIYSSFRSYVEDIYRRQLALYSVKLPLCHSFIQNNFK